MPKYRYIAGTCVPGNHFPALGARKLQQQQYISLYAHVKHVYHVQTIYAVYYLLMLQNHTSQYLVQAYIFSSILNIPRTYIYVHIQITILYASQKVMYDTDDFVSFSTRIISWLTQHLPLRDIHSGSPNGQQSGGIFRVYH